jgi:hypothetical protein
LGIMGAGLGQTEGSIHGQPDIKGVAVILAIILPQADRAQGQSLGCLQSLVSTAWATKLAITASPIGMDGNSGPRGYTGQLLAAI